MKKVKVLLSLILVVAFCIIGSNEVKAYTTIDSQYLFTPSTFDTLILNYTSLPTLTVSGSERYTISDGTCSTGEPNRRINFPDSYRGKNLNSTITVDFKNCGTLNGKPINMKLIYSDIITSNSGSYLYWSAFGSIMKSTNEWWYNNVEHLKIDVYFYYTDSNTPINIDTAYLSIFSEDQNEGASSSTSKEEYLYTTTHMAYAQTLQSYTGRVFNNVYYGTADGNTEAGSLNCVAFRYGSTDHLQVELYGLNQKVGIGYHLQYTPLTATLPSDPVKSVDKVETELGDTLIYTIEQKISERFDDDFHYSSLVFKDTIDSNLTYNSLKVYNENGADITASAGTVGYNSQTRQLTYTFNSNYLNNMAYNGQVYKFEINTKVNNNSTSATVTDKASTTINNLHVLESNTVTSTLKSKVVVHYVNKQGVKIADDVVINGNYLDPYETQEKDIYAYELVDVSGNTTGTMNKNTIEVTYVYDLIRVNINLTKTLEATDSSDVQNLEGARFKLTVNNFAEQVEYANPDREYFSTYTDKNGNCVILGVPFGNYTIVEEVVPDLAYAGNFYLDDSSEIINNFSIYINKEENLSYSLKDVAKKMQITIYKEDIETGTTTQGDAHLEGAKYTIYKDADCTDEVETIAIQKNENGTYSATSGWYLSGTYYVKETEAPKGYLLDENVYTVSQDPASQTEEYSYHTVTSKDEVIKGSINVIKYNNESDSTQDSPAEGAVLRLTLNSNPDKYYEATVDENGYLEFIDDDYKDEYPYTIPYGKYTISEVKASNSGEHIFIDKQQTEITYDGQVQKYILNDEYVRMKLSIEIRDSETSKLIPGGATFKIWDADNQKWYEEMSFPSGEYISEFTTNDKGQLTFNRHLEAGNYVIYEIKAPEGYYLDDNLREGAKGYEFTVGVAENGDVKVYHDGTEEVLAYEEVIYDNTPTKMYSYTATLYNTPQKAVVNIEKLAEQFIRADRTNTEYGYLNTPVYELRGLGDVSFRLVAAEDITTPEGTIRYTKGQVVSNDITDKDGLANTSEVYLGKYVIEEVSTPNGYIISSQPVNLDIVYTNQYEKVQYVDTQLENERQDVNVSFKKEFKELENSRFKIEGQEAIFGIYTRNSLKNYNDENVLGQDELVDIMIMDNNNNVASNVNLPEGTYYVKELYVSNPYEKSNEQYDFTVEFINSEDRTLSLTVNDGVITNVADVAEFELIVFPDTVWNELDIENEFDRKDLEDLAEVFGVADKTYGVYSDEECTKPVMTIDDKEATFVTNEDGIINVPDMPTGTYYLKEIIAPYGYELSDEVIKVEINEDDNFVLLKAKEPLKKASLLQKIDSFTKDVLAGVKFEITDENDELVYTGVTNEEGIVEIPIIYFENGQEYYYKEISAPDMYNINDEKQKFIAKYDEEKCEWTLNIITVENERKTIDEVIVRKTDADKGNPLQGCVFTIVLLDENGQEYINKNGETIYLVKDVVTNENGEYVINNVPYGTYKFVEITPPEGYEMDEDITGLTFTIDENSPDTVIFEVTNTGDIAVIAIVCVAVVCIIGIVFVIVRKKKESK